MIEFRAFDGEASNENYWLLACSDGTNLVSKPYIDSMEAIEYLSQPKYEHTKNVWFAFNYDVNKIFEHAPKEIQIELFREGKTTYNGYEIKYIPRKILRIRRPNSKYTVVHYDVWGFFQTKFVKALEKWGIKVPELIAEYKMERDNFANLPEEKIIEYNNLECVKLVEMMNLLQSKLEKVGLADDLRGYHGAGAISSVMLRATNAKRHLPKKLPDGVRLFRRLAYFGGRIELFKRGKFTDIYHYDINSCYPTAVTLLPSLANKNWINKEKATMQDLEYFGIVKVKWKPKKEEGMILGAFPYRLKDGYVIFPSEGVGAYHTVEVKAAIEKGLWDIELGEIWYLEPPYTYPFKDYIEEKMALRLKLKAKKDFANIPIKLGANGLYGKFAQKPDPKQDRQPEFRELLYAGFITAYGRSELMRYCEPTKIILLATDGIFSEVPLKCPIGEGLGQFEFTHHKTGKFVLAGIYKVDDETKARGFKELDLDRDWDKIQNDEELSYTEKVFIGIKRALAQPKFKMAQFQEHTKHLDWNHNYKRVFWRDDYSITELPPAWQKFSYPYNGDKKKEEDLGEFDVNRYATI